MSVSRNQQRQARQLAAHRQIPYQQALNSIRSRSVPAEGPSGAGQYPDDLSALARALERELALVDQLAAMATHRVAYFTRSTWSPERAAAVTADRMERAREHLLSAPSTGPQAVAHAARTVVAEEMAKTAREAGSGGTLGANVTDKNELLGVSAVDRYRRQARANDHVSCDDQDRYLNAALDQEFWTRALALAAQNPDADPNRVRAALREVFEQRLALVDRRPQDTDPDGDLLWMARNHPESVSVYAETLADALDCSLPVARRKMAQGEFGVVDTWPRNAVPLRGYIDYWERTGRKDRHPDEVGAQALMFYGDRAVKRVRMSRTSAA